MSTSSNFSVAASLGSDLPDDSLLPDLSDTAVTKRRLVDDVDILNLTQRGRPSHLPLRKRNSDLPGRVRRFDDWTGAFPVGLKSYNSDNNLNRPIEDYVILEERESWTNLAPASPTIVSSENGVSEKQVGLLTLIHNETPIVKGAGETEKALGERAMSMELIPDEGEKRRTPEQNGDLDGPKDLDHTAAVESRLGDYSSAGPLPIKENQPSDLFSTSDSFVDEHEPLLETETESRALFVPVGAAIQERRPSNGNVAEVTTPSCSTAQADTEVKEERRVGRANSLAEARTNKEGRKEKKSEEAKDNSKPRALTRVSVKDRRRHYEPEGVASAGARRSAGVSKKGPSDMANVIDVASRKQLFEHGGSGRGSYRRVSDLGSRKPRSDSTGSIKIHEIVVEKSAEETNAKSNNSSRETPEGIEGTEVRLRSKKEKSEGERPRSLILERLSKVGTEFEPLLDSDKLQPVEIPLDNENGDDDPRKHEKLRRSPSPSSPRGSKHSVRKSEEEREPQFV